VEPVCSLPHLQQPATWFRGFVECVVIWLMFYADDLLTPRPNPKLEDHLFSAVRDCLFNTFSATLHICRPFHHPAPENAPCSGDRDPLIMMPCRGDRDPLITVPCRGDRDPLITVPCCGDRDPLITVSCRGDRDPLITVPCRGDRDPLITVPCRGERDPLITVPCRGDRDPLITVPCRGERTHLSLWQGPTYHGAMPWLYGPTYHGAMPWLYGPTYHGDMPWWQGPTYHGAMPWWYFGLFSGSCSLSLDYPAAPYFFLEFKSLVKVIQNTFLYATISKRRNLYINRNLAKSMLNNVPISLPWKRRESDATKHYQKLSSW
jgi:hypothetical protein